VHELTDARRSGKEDVVEIIADLNPLLQGWGMSDVAARGQLESLVLAMLRDRGWSAIKCLRSGVDLDLLVEIDGVHGVVRFRNAFEVPRNVPAETIESSPIFMRIDLGEPSGEPSRWAVWDRYNFPSGKGAPRYRALVVAHVQHDDEDLATAVPAHNRVGLEKLCRLC
jgi:hypothetical protein